MSTFTLELYPDLFQVEHTGWTAYYVNSRGGLYPMEILGWLNRGDEVVPLIFGDTKLVPADTFNSDSLVFAEFRQAGSEVVLGMDSDPERLHWFVRAQVERVGEDATRAALAVTFGREHGEEVWEWAKRPYREAGKLNAALRA